jgi:hypothetical protein
MGRTGGLIESRRDRRALAADAGFGSLSIGSVLAGVLVAYGAFAVLVGIAAAIVDALNIDTDITTDYEQLGIVGGLIVAGILLVSYLFGGYVAGRMARRAGVRNGLLVAVLGLAIAAAVAALVRHSDAETINSNLRSLGVPTTADEYGQAFTVAGIASLVAIFIGSLLGGSLGERWHGKLLARAANPAIGTEADARKRSAADMAKAEEERTLAFDRARTSNPARARRVDRDALSAADRRVLDDDHDWDRIDQIERTDRTERVERAELGAPKVAPTVAPAGRNGRVGHNRAGESDRVLTGRAVNENTVITNRAGAPDPVIEDARAQKSWSDDEATPDTARHGPFRRRPHRRDH